ncbi:MAG: AMP-binding protein [Alphaproteobacteria bacterium]|nr:AMP-binding protein [Alphaproteobacteria bacterium]
MEGGERIWLGRTFADAVEEAAARHGAREAVVFQEQRLTFAALAGRVRDFAMGLAGLGIGKGDHVALWMSDCIEWVVARWAVPYIGAILVPVNTRLRGSDLAYILRQSNACLLVMDQRFGEFSYLDVLETIAPGFPAQPAGAWQTPELPRLRAAIARGPDAGPALFDFAAIEGQGRARLAGDPAALAGLRAAVRPEDVAQIVYTSGTTSLPKGAMVRHGPLLQNNFNSGRRVQVTEADAYLLSVPSFSASGVANHVGCLVHGAKLVLMERFSAEEFCRLVERERASMAFFADPLVYDLQRFPRRSEFDLSSLRTGSGGPLSQASFDFLCQEIGLGEMVHTYGMSETSNAVCRGDGRASFAERRRSAGRPLPDIRVRIVDPASGRALAQGEAGEICVGGYTVMAGYYDKPEDTAAMIDGEGWLHTGDLGCFNGFGELVFMGRLKDVIKPGGFNVATSEIEEFLLTHPAVAQAAVIGLPDARLGEVPCAFIERRPGMALAEAELIDWCRRAIASYKVPRHVLFVNEWPLTGTHKIRKNRLKEMASALLDERAP